jgi:hypothetical protein
MKIEMKQQDLNYKKDYQQIRKMKELENISKNSFERFLRLSSFPLSQATYTLIGGTERHTNINIVYVEIIPYHELISKKIHDERYAFEKYLDRNGNHENKNLWNYLTLFKIDRMPS